MRINKQDTQGTKPLLGKGELGYDDYTAGGDTGRVYVGTGTENIALAERLESNMMTKAQFNALADERKANRAGSGFESFGSNFSGVNIIYNVNNGINVFSISDNIPNSFMLSVEDVTSSKTQEGYPYTAINGVKQKLKSIGHTYNKIQLPIAPTIYPHDTVLTTEQINSGVIKHADASNSGLIVNGKFDTDTSGWYSSPNFPATLSNVNGKLRVTATSNYGRAIQGFSTVIGKKYFIKGQKTLISGTAAAKINLTNNLGLDWIIDVDNIGEFTATDTTTYITCALSGSVSAGAVADFDNIEVYPADAISRSDLVFLESWHEDISEKNFVYPLGNVQYLGGNTDGLTGVANGNFTGFETYSLFGNWQTPSSLVGKGYVWSNLTEAQKRAFIANPENNCYLDGDKTIQVRYRVRVVQGLSDTGFNTYPYNNYFNNPSSGYVKPKGKQVVVSSDWGIADSLGIYGHGIMAWTANLSYANELGIFSATSSNGSTTGFLNGSYNGQCFALPIALVHR